MTNSRKQAVLRALKFAGIFRLARFLTSRRVRILCYHGIWLGDDAFSGDGMFMRAETFLGRLECIRRAGFAVVDLGVVVEALRRNERLPRAAVVITIDDGWYSVLAKMSPALASYGFPSTLYVATRHVLTERPVPQIMARYLRAVAGARVAASPDEDAMFEAATDLTGSLEARLGAARAYATSLGLDVDAYERNRAFHYMTPAELPGLRESGMDIQLHTHNHSMGDLKPASVRDEIARNREELARILGGDESEFTHFCYPSGRWCREVGAALQAEGIESATTTARGLARASDDRYFLPRLLDAEEISLIEFEAELYGVLEIARVLRRVTYRLFGRAATGRYVADVQQSSSFADALPPR